MASKGVLEGQVVVIEDGRIATFGPVGQVQIPSDSEVIEGGGINAYAFVLEGGEHRDQIVGLKDKTNIFQSEINQVSDTLARNQKEFKGKIDLAIDLNDIRGRRCRY